MLAADRQLRRLCGAVCSCCSTVGEAACRVVGGNGKASAGRAAWAGRASCHYLWQDGEPTARYDFAIALGAEEGAWKLRERRPLG